MDKASYVSTKKYIIMYIYLPRDNKLQTNNNYMHIWP